MNLFKGYMTYSDRVFHRYIKKKMDAYEEEDDISASELITYAKLKYDIIKERNLWNAPSPQEQQILALRSEVNALKNAKKKTTAQTSNAKMEINPTKK